MWHPEAWILEGSHRYVNYNIPLDTQSYIHRIGRTGRAGEFGEAFTIVSIDELKELERIKKSVGDELEHMVIKYLDRGIDFSTLKKVVEATDIQDRALEFLDGIEMDRDEFLKRIVTLFLNIDVSNSLYIGYDLDSIQNMGEISPNKQKVAQAGNRVKKQY